MGFIFLFLHPLSLGQIWLGACHRQLQGRPKADMDEKNSQFLHYLSCHTHYFDPCVNFGAETPKKLNLIFAVDLFYRFKFVYELY